MTRVGTGEIQAGDRAGVFLKLKPEIELKRGGVLYDPKTKPQVLMTQVFMTAQCSWLTVRPVSAGQSY